MIWEISLITKVSDRQGLCGWLLPCSLQSRKPWQYQKSRAMHHRRDDGTVLTQDRHRSTHPPVGIRMTYISEVQCSSACEKEAERTGPLALVDRLAWQTSINTAWGSGSHCNEQQRIRSWNTRQLLQGRYKEHPIWGAECQVWIDKQLN